MFENDEYYMQHCLQIAAKGLGSVAPNPMVGCVIVYENKIIGEGFHEQFGEAHAEVNAIKNVLDKLQLQNSTLYVNLEPCAHYGKTAPCADLIIKHKIKRVVIGCVDVFSKVNGQGIIKLRNAGIEVLVGILEGESIELNKRFFTFYTKKRPYIILRWAQTKDGFIAKNNSANFKISNDESHIINHIWRSQEQAILIGKTTANIDNPSLTSRLVNGKNPLRFVIDLNNTLSRDLKIFADGLSTYIFTLFDELNFGKTIFLKIKNQENFFEEMMTYFYKLNIQSLIVEGGSITLQSFIDAGLYDEIRVFESEKNIENGLAAPTIKNASLIETIVVEEENNNNTLKIFLKF